MMHLGVGHLKTGYSNVLNPLGADFFANGHEWTLSLRKIDWDGDGHSNGEELGDPDCI